MTTWEHATLGALVGAICATLPDAALWCFGWRADWLPETHWLVKLHRSLHAPSLVLAGALGYASHLWADRLSRHRHKPRAVLCASGGMDSFAIWLLWGRPPCVFADYGQKYARREELALAEWAAACPDLDMTLVTLPPAIGQAEQPDGFIPYRNLWMVMAALAQHPDADEVWIGATAGETSPDKSRAWARTVSRALSRTLGRRVRVRLPARRYTKTDLMRRVARQAPAYADLLWSRPSCYAVNVRGAGCGRCMSCLRRWVAAVLCGRADQWFEQDPARQGLRRDLRWWRYMRRVPVADWWGVARNNLQLWRALRLARRRA